MTGPTTPALSEALASMGRVHHVAVVVRDLEAALGFYRDTLGMPLELILPVPSDQVRIGFLTVGESRIELVEPTSEDTGVARFLASLRTS